MNSIQDAIRHKCRLLKQEEVNNMKFWEEAFEPTVHALESHKNNTKTRVNSESDLTILENDALNGGSIGNDISFKSFTNGHNPLLINKYLSKLYKNSTKYLDNVYGVYNQGDTLMIGNSPIQFKNDYVKVDKVSYTLSEGLLELLFRKKPDVNLISSDDIRKYHNIIEASNACKKGYRKNGAIRKLKSNKFKDFIAPLFDVSRKKAVDKESLQLLNMEKDVLKNVWDDDVINSVKNIVRTNSQVQHKDMKSQTKSVKLNEDYDIMHEINNTDNDDANDIEFYRKLYGKLGTNLIDDTQNNQEEDTDQEECYREDEFTKSGNLKRRYSDGTVFLPQVIKKRLIDWNDPNELVNRLRFLVSDGLISNWTHIREIHSIIEKLREFGYIY